MIEIFFDAIRTGDLETVLMFLEAGINPNIQYYGFNSLQYAICYGHVGIENLLLATGMAKYYWRMNSH